MENILIIKRMEKRENSCLEEVLLPKARVMRCRDLEKDLQSFPFEEPSMLLFHMLFVDLTLDGTTRIWIFPGESS